MRLSLAKAATLAAVTATMAITTGCATKRSTSEVVVAPLGVPGGQVAYTGGAIVTNTTALTDAATALQSVVYFGFDLSNITPEAAAVLNQHANLLRSNPTARVLVAGHTDERGSREYNMALGERRAQAVRSYLAAQGIPAGSIEIISYGEERPAVAGTTEAAYAQNRRAELAY